MSSLYPTKLVQFEIYGNQAGVVTPGATAVTGNLAANAFAGVANVTLPDIQFQSENLEGSGIWGQIDLPMPLVMPMGMTIQFFSLTSDAVNMFDPTTSTQIDARGTYSGFNTATYGLGPIPIRVLARVLPKGLNLAQWVPASKTDVTVALQVIALTVYLSGNEVIASDPSNGILRQNGNDLLAPYRSAIAA